MNWILSLEYIKAWAKVEKKVNNANIYEYTNK